MGVRVAVDFGTSSTCVAVSVDDHEPQVVVVDGQPLLPSAVFAGPDATLFVGHEAERQAAIDPACYEPHPKRRIAEGELLLGDRVFGVPLVVRAVLDRAVTEASRLADGVAVDQLVLTHPADWGALRTGVLRSAAAGLAAEVVLLAEPVAAAVFHAATHPATGQDGAALAVLDLGGGTVDASVVQRAGPAFRVLAAKGDPGFGGADIDQAVLDHIGTLVGDTDAAAWQTLVEGRDLAARRRRRLLRHDVRGAKETLSRHAYTDVPLPPPFPDAHLTRADLETLIGAPVNRVVDLLLDTVREAGVPPAELVGVFLVGGSSRIPLISRLVHERSGVVPTALDQPETVVARGALRAVAAPDHLAPPALQPELSAAPEPPTHPTTPPTTVPTAPPTTLPKAPRTAPSGAESGRAGPAIPRWRTGRRVALALAAAAVLPAAAGIGAAVGLGSPPQVAPGTKPGTPAPEREIAQYDYRFALPEGWKQSGAEATTRRVQITPDGSAPDTDLIVVQEFRLDYDASADRARAIRDIHRFGYDKAAAQGLVTGFQDSARVAGRDVVRYQEMQGHLIADWYVLLQGATEISVACQRTPDGAGPVAAACDRVLTSLRITA